ncbi:hypothetical protein MHK_006103 [Candidatus Magnetomorum sp. HK-1]|nr:hypothetical protein MHK_006103 [Candidatus Magnetomorum sp. HK-1]
MVSSGVNAYISNSDSTAFGGLVVQNDVRSDVDAYINQANVSASGNIYVRAFAQNGGLRAKKVVFIFIFLKKIG